MPTLESLPAISAVKSITETIIKAYQAAVAGLAQITDESEKRQEKHRLFWGYRQGSKIDGIRDPNSVELLFRRITTKTADMDHPVPLPGYPMTDAEGNKVYCFKLTQHYAGRGKSGVGRLSDIVDSHDLDRVSIGMDVDPDTRENILRLQAPKILFVRSEFVTVILSGDETKFIAWFCGEPKQVWNPENITKLLLPNGELDLGKIFVRVGIDYDLRSRETRAIIKSNLHKANYTKPMKHFSPSINPMAEAMASAEATEPVDTQVQ